MSGSDWQDQAGSVMKSWGEAQNALWQSWADLAVTAQSSAFSSSLVDQWQKLAQQNLEAMTTGAAPIAKNTAEQFLATQSVVLRFLEFSARAWEAAAPKIEKGEDWQDSLKQAMDQLRRQWLQFPTDVAGTVQDTDKLWQVYLEQWKSFGQPWEAVFRQAPGYLGQVSASRGSALIEFSNLYRDAYNQTLGRLAGSPNLGLTRELNQKLQQGFDAWVAWHLANLEYHGVLAETWDQAFEQFGQDLLALAEQDKTIESVRDLILLWTRGAEQVFTDAFRSDKYVLAQGKLLSASMTYRMREREIIEVFLKMYDLPTRSELDEAHRRIYELRKEAKALKKALAKLAASSQDRAPSTPVAPDAAQDK